MGFLRRRLPLILLWLSLAWSVSGCWNGREIETLGFVMAVGIDKAQEEGKIQLTMLVAKPFAIGGGEKGTPQESPIWILSSTGETVFDAIRNGNSQSPRRLFFAHNRWLLFGEDFAREGILSALDLWSRDGEARRTVQVAVAKGAAASEMLQTQFELERQPSEGGRGVLDNASITLSTVVTIRLNEFVQLLETVGSNAVASRVEIVPRPQEADIRGEVLREKVGSSARFTGAAAFKGDRLVGWLDKSETRGLNWVRSKVKSGLIVIENPLTRGSSIGVEIIRGRCQSQVEPTDGRFIARIRIEVEGNLGDTTGLIEPERADLWVSMESRMAEAIREEIRAAVVKAQELQTDYLGFGASLYRSNPKLWEKVKDGWQELLFPDMDIEVDVRAKLRRTGLVTRSDRVTTG